MSDDEEIIDPLPPTPERVARRAVVLAVVSCRGFVEGDDESPERAKDLAKRADSWLRSLNIDSELSRWERSILKAEFGTLADRDCTNATWLSEAMTVLAWALGKTEMPGYEEMCDPLAVANQLGFLKPIEHTVLYQPALFEGVRLRDYNEFIYNLHWRLRDFSLHKKSYNFESLARKAWGEPILRYGLKIEESDLCAGGLPLPKATERDVRVLGSISRERHRASNWLIGYASEDFYEVTTDT